MKAGTKWIFYHTGDERTAVGTGTVTASTPAIRKSRGARQGWQASQAPQVAPAIKAEKIFAGSPLLVIGASPSSRSPPSNGVVLA